MNVNTLLSIAFVMFGFCIVARAQTSEKFIAAHNDLRLAAHVPPLQWSETLAQEAAAWARELASRRVLAHSSPHLRSGEGENVAFEPASENPAAAIGRWGAERRFFTGGVFPHVSSTGEWGAVSHYTQIVWRETRAVGCGIARAVPWDVVVCRYAQPGNVFGMPVF